MKTLFIAEMKRSHISIITFFCIFLFSCQSGSDHGIVWNPDLANSLEDLKAGFKQPPVDFSTAPFWVWNDLVTKEKIDFQLEEFKDKGIHMAFIHPRPGLITEYLGNEWFELVKYSVERAKELDMKIWLYDENSYPSGFAGGHVPAATFATSDPIAGLELRKLDVLSEQDTNQYFLIIKQVGNSFANITNSRSKYFGQPGKYYAFKKWYYPTGEGWHGGFSYVDLLAYGITEKFINVTMDGYEDYIGEDLGKTIPGIFTDEPNINTRGGDNFVMRYTPVLFNRFEKTYGYQLQTYLPCLYDEIGDWKNVRHDYYSLLLEMFLERWGEPWRKYTDEKNLKWTGHYWEHGWPDPKHGGDNMAMYAYHQYPGIDMLFNTDERPDQFGNIRAVKELSSVVNQLDKARALSETYGGAGWELTFEDMKRLGDWEYVLGVNFLNQHLAHMTLKGARKRDYPQSMSYHTSWWDNYKPLNEYFHRLSFAMTAGKQVNRILVMEPTSTTWMYHSPLVPRAVGTAARPNDLIRDEFHNLLTKLEKNQVEYDLGCESIIASHGSVDGDQFSIGVRNYDLIVMPPMLENLMEPTYHLLLEYLKNGGKVLSMSDVPVRLDGNKSSKMTEELGRYADQWITVNELTKEIIDAYMLETDFVAKGPESWGGNVFHHRRVLKDGQLCFFTNYDKEKKAKVSFKATGRSVLELDLLTGEIHALHLTPEDGMMGVQFDLPPAGSKLLFFSESSEKGDTQLDGEIASQVSVEASETTVERLQPNVLTLDYCDLTLAGRDYPDLYYYNAADSIYKEHLKEIYGYNYNPWSNAVQYRTRILDKNNFDANSGFEVRYHFTLALGDTPENLNAVVEWAEFYEVKINGSSVDATPDEWWLDKSFGVFDIVAKVKPGKNTLSLIASPMDILAEVEPIYLVGDFGVKPQEKGWMMVPNKKLEIGSWKDQKLPFYSHSVSYSKTIEKPKTNKVLVKLNEWAGTVAEVKVNGQSAGIIGWQPFTLDVTDQLQDGPNEVSVIVTGSLKNQMGPHHFNPIPGFVTPWSFFNGPADQPAGSTYDLLDYGLFEDFEVLVSE